MEDWLTITNDALYKLFPIGTRVYQDGSPSTTATVIAPDDPRYTEEWGHIESFALAVIVDRTGMSDGWYVSTPQRRTKCIIHIVNLNGTCAACNNPAAPVGDYLCEACRGV